MANGEEYIASLGSGVGGGHVVDVDVGLLGVVAGRPGAGEGEFCEYSLGVSTCVSSNKLSTKDGFREESTSSSSPPKLGDRVTAAEEDPERE